MSEGKHLKQTLLNNKLRSKDLAEALGVTVGSVSIMISKDTFTLKTIDKLKAAFVKLGVEYVVPTSSKAAKMTKMEDILLKQVEQKDSVIRTLQDQLNIMQHLYASHNSSYDMGKYKDNNNTRHNEKAPRGKQIFFSA